MGICAFVTGSTCQRDRTGFSPLCEDDFGAPCACLVLRREGELEDRGWVTMAASCRAYRDRYPGDFECLDNDWELID